MSAMLAIGVCACGGVGAAARYICDSYIKALWRKTFAYCSQQDFSAVSQRSQP